MDLRKLKSFNDDGGSDSENNIKRHTSGDALILMNKYYNKISATIVKYLSSDSTEDMECYRDSVTVGFNNYVQAFMDVVQVVEIKSGVGASLSSSLQHFVNSYKRLFPDISGDELVMINYLTIRNSIIHEYEDFDELTNNALNKLIVHLDGLKCINKTLRNYLKSLDALDVVIRVKRK